MTPRQIRAARGFLGWSRREMALKSGLAYDTIKAIECQRIKRSKNQTIHVIVTVMERNGIMFTETGGIEPIYTAISRPST